MDVKSQVPAYVTYAKIGQWLDTTDASEGVHLVTSFQLVAEKHCNWALFYCWCYVRSYGFSNVFWKTSWDVARTGKKYETSKDGITDALNIFLAFGDTDKIPEETQVLLVYRDVLEACEGIVFEPTPIPPPVIEPEKPKPEPVPEPTPVPEKPKPSPTDGSSIGEIFEFLLPIALTLWRTVGSFLPLPKWVHTVVELFLKLIGGK
jgi:hypothetical protein